MDETSGAPAVQFDVGVQGQGVKRCAQPTGATNSEPSRGAKLQATGTDQPRPNPVARVPTTKESMVQDFAIGAQRPRPQRPLVRVKRLAIGEASKDVARLASLAAKARRPAHQSGAGV